MNNTINETTENVRITSVSELLKIPPSYKGQLAAVKENGFLIQFIQTQTPELCLAALSSNFSDKKYIIDYCFNDEMKLWYSRYKKMNNI